jgi:hypothetical protein
VTVPTGVANTVASLEEVGLEWKASANSSPKLEPLIHHANGAMVRQINGRHLGQSELLSFLPPLEAARYLNEFGALFRATGKVASEEVVPLALGPGHQGPVQLLLSEQSVSGQLVSEQSVSRQLVCSFDVKWQSGNLDVTRLPFSGHVAPYTLRVRLPPVLREFPTSSLVCWLPALQMAHEYGHDLAGRLLVEHMRAGQISYPSHLLLQVLAIRIQHKSSRCKTIEVPALSHSNSTFAELAKQAIDPTVPVFLELVDQTTMTARWIELRAPLTIVPAPSTIFTLDKRDWVDWSKQLRGKARLGGECATRRSGPSDLA